MVDCNREAYAELLLAYLRPLPTLRRGREIMAASSLDHVRFSSRNGAPHWQWLRLSR